VHLADAHNLEEAHKALLSKGQVVSKYFRLMRRDMGYIWVQMQASLINNPRSMPRPVHIVGICTLIGDDYLDQSRLLLDEPNMPNNQDDSCRADSLHVAQLEIRANQSRKIVKARQESNAGSTMVKEHGKLSIKRATFKRREKAVSPAKITRHPNGNGNNDCKIFVENGPGGITQITQGQSEGSARDSLIISQRYKQTIGLMRRPSDDTCSVASSSASTGGASSATTVSNVVPIMMPCPPPSVSSCSSSSSSSNYSSSSLSAPMACNISTASGLDLSGRFHQMPSRVLDGMNQLIQVEHDEASFYQQVPQQQCYTIPINNQEDADINQLYPDHTQHHTGNYWQLASNKAQCHGESDGLDCIKLVTEQPNNAITEQYYYNLNEHPSESDGHLVGYYQYGNNCTTFYNEMQDYNSQVADLKSETNVNNNIQAPQYQYCYPSDQLNSESISMTTSANPVSTITACFVGDNNSF
jgi:hypothetical protein